MGRPFEAAGTRIRVRLGAQERQLLARLLDEVGEMLDDGQGPREDEDPLAALVGFDPNLPDDFPERDDRTQQGERDGRDEQGERDGRDEQGERDGRDEQDGRSARDEEAARGERNVGGAPDPALSRLLPDAHREDPELAEEFRRLTETGLRARKRTTLALASAALQRRGHVLLSGEEAAALAKGLTDVRLVLGERLGLRTDEDAEVIAQVLSLRLGGQDPWTSAARLYDVLTWWQEALVSVLGR
jgi:hypothetical protein